MSKPLIILICTQILFTSSDLVGRFFMRKYGFTISTFLMPWFIFYFSIRNIAMFGQLYIFTASQLGKTMALFGAASIILSNILGFLILKEILSAPVYIGVSLAIISFLVLAFK